MWEKTLRYPGHVEKIRLLKDLGFFDESPINNMIPRKITAKILEKRLRKPGVKDVLAMKIEVCGLKDNLKTTYIYHMLEHYDEERGVTAMARTTGYLASIIAELVIKGVIGDKGVVPPEKLGMSNEVF